MTTPIPVPIPVAIGDHASFRKTVGESDVYLYAGLTGDLAPNHVDEDFMRRTAYGRRIAHGTLVMGFMSTTSTRIVEQAGAGAFAVSLGYDHVRFLKPVFIGDTLTVSYTVTTLDPARSRSVSKIEVTNQDGALVAVAGHLLKWLPAEAPAASA